MDTSENELQMQKQPVHLIKGLVRNLSSLLFQQADYDVNELILHISRVLSSTIDISHMCETVVWLLQEKMHVQSIGLFIYNRDGTTLWFSSPQERHLQSWKKENVDALRMENTVRIFDDLSESPTKQAMRQTAVSMVVPLTIKQFPIGYLFFGPKKSGRKYFTQDLATIQILAPEFAVAVDNTLQYAEIKKFTETLREEVEKATADLRAANTRLQEIDRLKDEFLLVTSHNLRTPMTTIVGYVWILLRKMQDIPPESTQKLKRIYNCSQHMLALINDMLDVSRIESGRMQIVLETISVVSIARDVCEELMGLAEDRQITLTVLDGVSYAVKADRNRTHEVLVNLISNAIKFTPQGGAVQIAFEEKPEYIATSIADTGIGISQEDKEKLFHKYGRIEAPSLTPMPQASGTGLGLYICKKIIELSGGTIDVTSEPGRGSTFTFTLPKAQATDLTKI